ncbi:unnamed protein product [Prunus brigantina]
MNGFFLQSTTTPRKACKGIERPFVRGLELANRGLTRPAWWGLIRASMVESDQGKWVSPIGIWDRETQWCDSHKSR